MDKEELHAIIGVATQGKWVLYVKRSELMENYPGVWSLLSHRVTRDEISKFWHYSAVQPFFERMSEERLEGIPIRVDKFLTAAYCDKLDHRLYLYMYQLRCDTVPKLNPHYYTEARFMTAEEYLEARQGGMCGLCLSMWSQYCLKNGLVDKPFAEVHDLEPKGELYG